MKSHYNSKHTLGASLWFLLCFPHLNLWVIYLNNNGFGFITHRTDHETETQSMEILYKGDPSWLMQSRD